MYLESLEYLEEERDAWRPFEALLDLTDDELSEPLEAAHGWSGRNLMGHLLAWQAVGLQIATDLAVNESSPTIARVREDWDTRGGEVVTAEIDATWSAMSMDDLRARFRDQPGELRGYLTVVPEARWLKHAANLKAIDENTRGHYEEHRDDLAAVLAAAGR